MPPFALPGCWRSIHAFPYVTYIQLPPFKELHYVPHTHQHRHSTSLTEYCNSSAGFALCGFHLGLSLGLTRVGLLDDPDLGKFLRCDSYLSNKLAKIVRELQRIQAGRSGGPSRTARGPDAGVPKATLSPGEPPKPAGEEESTRQPAALQQSGRRALTYLVGRSPRIWRGHSSGNAGFSADQ